MGDPEMGDVSDEELKKHLRLLESFGVTSDVLTRILNQKEPISVGDRLALERMTYQVGRQDGEGIGSDLLPSFYTPDLIKLSTPPNGHGDSQGNTFTNSAANKTLGNPEKIMAPVLTASEAQNMADAVTSLAWIPKKEIIKESA